MASHGSNRHRTAPLERRALLKGAAALACSAIGPSAVSGTMGGRAHSQATPDAGTLTARDGEAVVATRTGRVAGYIRKGIYTFKGIPYAGDSSGANRFMPPVKQKSWDGIRSCRQYGFVAPQGARSGWANDEEAFMFAWDDGVQSEDCCRINLERYMKGKRGMVWLMAGDYGGLGRNCDPTTARTSLAAAMCGRILESSAERSWYLDLSKYGEQFAA